MDRKGELKSIVGLVVALFVASILLPPALNTVFNATTTNWNPAVATVFKVLLPVLAILSIALVFMPKLRARFVTVAKLYGFEIDDRGEISTIVSIAIGLLIAGILLPIAISQIYATQTTGWSSAVIVVFTVLLPVLAVLGIAMVFLGKVKTK